MKLNSRELATVLAALRLYQRHREVGGLYTEVWDIATDHERHTALNVEEIDELCQRINFGDGPVKIVHTNGTTVDRFPSHDDAERWLDNYRVSPEYKATHYRIIPA